VHPAAGDCHPSPGTGCGAPGRRCNRHLCSGFLQAV